MGSGGGEFRGMTCQLEGWGFNDYIYFHSDESWKLVSHEILSHFRSSVSLRF